MWETTEPTQATAALHVVGLNSARPYRHQSGALRDAQLRAAAERLARAAEGAYRVVVLHHHLVGAPWRAARKRPVARRNHVLRALVAAGADLILAGHIHQAAVSERHEFEVVGGDRAPSSRSRPASGSRARTGSARPAASTYTRSTTASSPSSRTSGTAATGAHRPPLVPARASCGGSRRAPGPVSGRCWTKRRWR